MNKSDIVSALATNHPDLPYRHHADTVDEVFTVMCRFIKKGGRLNITNFGSFHAEYVGPRRTRNPKTGLTVDAPPRIKVQFRPSAKLKSPMAS